MQWFNFLHINEVYNFHQAFNFLDGSEIYLVKEDT